eukprot:IDg2916t1
MEMDSVDSMWYTLKCYVRELWKYMPHRSCGEFSEGLHASEIDGNDSHQYMVTILSWLYDVVEFGRLVIKDMELCTRCFGPVNASLDIGGTYYGPSSGAAVIEAAKILSDIANAMASEEEY